MRVCDFDLLSSHMQANSAGSGSDLQKQKWTSWVGRHIWLCIWITLNVNRYTAQRRWVVGGRQPRGLPVCTCRCRYRIQMLQNNDTQLMGATLLATFTVHVYPPLRPFA